MYTYPWVLSYCIVPEPSSRGEGLRLDQVPEPHPSILWLPNTAHVPPALSPPLLASWSWPWRPPGGTAVVSWRPSASPLHLQYPPKQERGREGGRAPTFHLVKPNGSICKHLCLTSNSSASPWLEKAAAAVVLRGLFLFHWNDVISQVQFDRLYGKQNTCNNAHQPTNEPGVLASDVNGKLTCLPLAQHFQ